MCHRGVVDYTVFVDAGVLLRQGLIPNDVPRRRSHHNVQVRRGLGQFVDIMAQHVSLGKQNFGEMLLLGRRGDIEPLKCTIDVGKCEGSIWVAVT